MKASELGFKDLTFKNQLKVAEALLHKELYIAGHTKPLVTPAIFQRTFTNWLSAMLIVINIANLLKAR